MDTYANRGYGMNIPKKLKEKRDELASQPPWRIEGCVDFSYEFKSGFNAACNLLLPEIEKLSKVLDTYTDIYTPGNDAAKEALQSLREFLGEI